MYTGGPLLLGSAIDSIDALKDIDMAKLHEIKNVSGSSWEEDPMLRRDHDLYRFVKKLTKLRRSCDVFVHGRTRWGVSADIRPPRGVMVYSRLSESMEAVMVINPKGEIQEHHEFECDPSLNKQSDVYRDILDKDAYFTVDLREGRCFLKPVNGNGEISPFQVRILMHEDVLEKKDGEVFYNPDYDNMALCM